MILETPPKVANLRKGPDELLHGNAIPNILNKKIIHI
jgi:hypothetical protein